MMKIKSQLRRLGGEPRPPLIKDIRFGNTVGEIVRHEGEKQIGQVMTPPRRSPKRWRINVPNLAHDPVNN
jgi:hypothetical protein